mmetsp:Transcript_36623/g.117590  ORF Transcript_36623/g.117590 Transcript_36623/m.117590 type:complete len:449 (-) Transcript_36623:1923-3269(-)
MNALTNFTPPVPDQDGPIRHDPQGAALVVVGGRHPDSVLGRDERQTPLSPPVASIKLGHGRPPGVHVPRRLCRRPHLGQPPVVAAGADDHAAQRLVTQLVHVGLAHQIGRQAGHFRRHLHGHLVQGNGLHHPRGTAGGGAGAGRVSETTVHGEVGCGVGVVRPGYSHGHVAGGGVGGAGVPHHAELHGGHDTGGGDCELVLALHRRPSPGGCHVVRPFVVHQHGHSVLCGGQSGGNHRGQVGLKLAAVRAADATENDVDAGGGESDGRGDGGLSESRVLVPARHPQPAPLHRRRMRRMRLQIEVALPTDAEAALHQHLALGLRRPPPLGHRTTHDDARVPRFVGYRQARAARRVGSVGSVSPVGFVAASRGHRPRGPPVRHFRLLLQQGQVQSISGRETAARKPAEGGCGVRWVGGAAKGAWHGGEHVRRGAGGEGEGCQLGGAAGVW